MTIFYAQALPESEDTDPLDGIDLRTLDINLYRSREKLLRRHGYPDLLSARNDGWVEKRIDINSVSNDEVTEDGLMAINPSISQFSDAYQ